MLPFKLSERCLPCSGCICSGPFVKGKRLGIHCLRSSMDSIGWHGFPGGSAFLSDSQGLFQELLSRPVTRHDLTSNDRREDLVRGPSDSYFTVLSSSRSRLLQSHAERNILRKALQIGALKCLPPPWIFRCSDSVSNVSLSNTVAVPSTRTQGGRVGHPKQD